MTVEQLFAEFFRLVEASNGSSRLERFTLDLAVRGRLVPQHDDDAPAISLVAGPADETTRQGRRRRSPKTPPALETEPPYSVPEGWSWVHLGATGDIFNGTSASASEKERLSQITDGRPFIATKDVGYGRDQLDYENGLRVPLDDPRYVVASAGAVLICAEGGSAGRKTGITDRDICFGNKLYANEVRPGIQPRYMLAVYQSSVFYELFRRAMTGIIGGISRGAFVRLPVPLPPPAEQERIVSKLDELSRACDEFAEARRERERRRDRLVVASMRRMSESAIVQSHDVRFYLSHLDRMTARADQIPAWRRLILNLAVTGRLTDRVEGHSAEGELREVEARKRANALRKAKKVEPVSSDEEWCELPEGWLWTRWDQITDWITYGFTRPMPHVADGVPIVTGKNVNHGTILFDSSDLTTLAAFEALNDKDRPLKGDILLTKDGSIGRSAIVEDDRPFCINQSVAVLWLRSCHFDRRFLQLAIDCPYTQEGLLAMTEGVAIKHISIIDFGRMVFPLPPIAEQRRLVARVDELMGVLAGLERSLARGESERLGLLEATLAMELQSDRPTRASAQARSAG